MINFTFVSPTKIYFGKNQESNLANILLENNFKRILFVYGGGSIKKIGLYDKVIDQIKTAKGEYFELSGIRPNPNNIDVNKGIEIARNNNVDFVLVVGGGSVIDTAKAIAAGYYYQGDAFDFNLHKAVPTKVLPIGVILTLSASGSELSSTSVIQNDTLGVKSGFRSDLMRPMFAIMNPELTFSVNKYQTACGIVDIISHSLERYFCPSFEYEFSDDIALAIIKNTIKSGKGCLENPNNYDARALMMLCGSYSHNGLTSLGKKYVMSVHAMEHALSAYKPTIAHGAGLAILIPGWMNYVYKLDVDKFAKFGEEIFNLHFVNKDESARIGIQYLRDFFKNIGMPTSLKEVGINEKDIPILANMITENSTRLIGYSSIKPLGKDDIIKILSSLI